MTTELFWAAEILSALDLDFCLFCMKSQRCCRFLTECLILNSNKFWLSWMEKVIGSRGALWGPLEANPLSPLHLFQEHYSSGKFLYILESGFSVASLHNFLKIVSKQICTSFCIVINVQDEKREFNWLHFLYSMFSSFVFLHVHSLDIFIRHEDEINIESSLLTTIQILSTYPLSERNCLLTKPFSAPFYIQRLCVT